MENKFQKSCKKKGLKLALKIPELPFEIKIDTDPKLLQTVRSHLVINAIKFTDKGEIFLGISLQPKTVEFYVKDTGIGINENRRTQIFENFVQGDNSRTRNFEGSSLGLSICQGILKFKGSKISSSYY